MKFNKNSARIFRVYSVIFVLIFSPSFFYVALNASSMTVGVFFAMIYILIIVQKKIPSIKGGSSPLFSLLVMFIFYFIVNSIAGFDSFTFKSLLSFILLIFLMLCGAFLSLEISKLKYFHILLMFKSLSFFILAIGMSSLYWRLGVLGYEGYAKSIFPFAEPSHYAISVGCILFVTGLYLSTLMKIYLIATVGLMGVLYPSLILLIISLIMISLYFFSSIKKMFFLVMFFALMITYLVTFTDSLSYYIERLDFSETTRNLTALVYLQGWQDMSNALYASYGFGLGFQNMGILPPGEYGEIIYQLAGEYKNRADGGFLASKIIGEFGVFGIVLILTFLYRFYDSLIYIIKFINLNDSNKVRMMNEYSVSFVFGHSIIVMFFIEIFARGYGYFSPGVFLFFVAIFLTSFEKNNLIQDLRVKPDNLIVT
ncbi:MAG: hypothetical protein KC484_10945 [Colwelliaceae bacterium]|nr:hypothetical protein [Colwelliaceae bacterium]